MLCMSSMSCPQFEELRLVPSTKRLETLELREAISVANKFVAKGSAARIDEQ